MGNTLLKDKKFNGRYVALKNFNEKTIIADGKDLNEVYFKAAQKGCDEPVVLFVPVKDMVQIY